MELVDKGKIKLTNAVEISFLSADVQKRILDYIKDGNLLTKNKIIQLRDYDTGTTDINEVNKILNGQLKPATVRQIILNDKELSKYFPKKVTTEQIKKQIIWLLDEWKVKESESDDL